MVNDLLGVEVQLENVALNDLKVLLERLVKWDLLKVKAILRHVMKEMTREILGGVGQQGPVGPRGSTCPRGVQGAKGLRGVAGIQGPLGVQ